jgi:hypothetical protein
MYYAAKQSRDITFYDIPWYWTDDLIFELINGKVGRIEYMRVKRCNKYKMVRMTLRFSNAYEQIFLHGGVNVAITKGDRQYFLRMFDSNLTYMQIKEKFRWQAFKRIDDSDKRLDGNIIKDLVKIHSGFFWKND